MDPLTLFALANGAVNAVKAGCKLYKDIKGAAADVKGVLKDLDEQFHKAHPPEKPATLEQKKQFIEENIAFNIKCTWDIENFNKLINIEI